MKIRILLVDDHGLFRESLGRLLEAEPDMEIAGACQTPVEALSLLQSKPDIVLLDYDLGEHRGTTFLDLACTAGVPVKVLLVTAGMSDQDASHALAHGASGLFLKHSPPSQLIEAIHAVVEGGTWVDSRAMRTLQQASQPTSKPAVLPLTAREQAVLKGIFEGLANKEIAARLQISESSVKAGVQQLFDKTGVRTRGQLVRIALERHLDQ